MYLVVLLVNSSRCFVRLHVGLRAEGLPGVAFIIRLHLHGWLVAPPLMGSDVRGEIGGGWEVMTPFELCSFSLFFFFVSFSNAIKSRSRLSTKSVLVALFVLGIFFTKGT